MFTFNGKNQYLNYAFHLKTHNYAFWSKTNNLTNCSNTVPLHNVTVCFLHPGALSSTCSATHMLCCSVVIFPGP